MSKEAFHPEIAQTEYQILYADRLGKIFELFANTGIDARLVGSVGRAAVLGKPINSFQDEYGRLRDIDILILDSPFSVRTHEVMEDAKRRALPIPLEEHFQGKIIFEENSSTSIKYKDIVRAVEPVVFAERTGTVFDTEIPTLDPNTLFHLTALYGFMRPKDLHNVRQLLNDMKEQPSILFEGLYSPFHELNRERQKKYKLDQQLGHLRWCYHTNAPLPLRRSLSFISEPVWHALKRA